MRLVFPRIVLLPMAFAMALFISACGNDNNTVTGAGAVPRPTATAEASPSGSPTGTPSASPTGSATATPTGSPTDMPTGTPSASPTGAPSATPGGTPTNSVFFRGAIQSVSGTSLFISGQTVVTSGQTIFHRNGETATLAQFSVGERVRVIGTRNDDGSIQATKISFPED